MSAEVRLVRMDQQHLDATCRWLAESADLRRKIDCLVPPSPEGNAAYWRTKWADPSREDYAITLADGAHVGNCGLFNIDRARRKAELWVYLGGGYGAGQGGEAVRLLLDRAFAALGLNRVYLRVVADNERVVRFYERLGFHREGLLRQDTWHDGAPVDAHVLSVLASEHRRGAR